MRGAVVTFCLAAFACGEPEIPAELLWCAELDPSLWRAPGIAVGSGVVVRTGASGLDVLDARTGDDLWSVVGDFERPLPGIADGVVYANLPPDAVAAYRAADGAPLWKQELGDLGGDSGRTRNVYVARPGNTRAKEARELLPAEWTDLYLYGRHVPEWNRTIVATHRGNIVALDEKGRRRWRASGSSSFLVAAELRLVFTSRKDEDRRLVALDADTGEDVWSTPAEGTIAAVSDGRLLVAAQPVFNGRIDGRLQAFDAKSGRRLWTFRPPLPVAGEATDAETGETVRHEKVTVRRGTISHPGDETSLGGVQVAAGGEIVMTSARAFRFGLKASDGTMLWKMPREGIRLANVERDGFVWGVSDRAEIVAVDPRDGLVAGTIKLSKLKAAEAAPKLRVERGSLPPTEEMGDLSWPVFDGDVCYVTAASGWTIAIRIPPFR